MSKRSFRVGLAVVTVCLSLATCAPLTNRMLLFPTTDERPLSGERVIIPSPLGDVETVRAKSPGVRGERGAKAIVLRFYGNADRADGYPAWEASAFGDWPVEVWGVNYPGFGRSQGGARLAGVARAADLAFSEAEKRGLPIYVIGTSIGTTAALYLGSKGKVRGVILHNPPPIPQLIRGRYGWWNLWLLALPISWSIPSTMDNIANAKRTTAPTLVVSAEKDEIVPFEYQTDVYNACAGKKDRIVVSGAGHNDGLTSDDWSTIRVAVQRLGWDL